MGNMMDLDYTVLIQLMNFLVTIVVLHYLLIKPVRRQIAARKELVAGLTAEIDIFAQETDRKLTDFEAALAEARAQATIARDALKTDGLSTEQAVMDKAQADAQAFLQDSRERVAREMKDVEAALFAQVDAYAEAAASRILG